jgi:hypothetical protein
MKQGLIWSLFQWWYYVHAWRSNIIRLVLLVKESCFGSVSVIKSFNECTKKWGVVVGNWWVIGRQLIHIKINL